MTMTRQTILASRPAATVLALSLVAGLSAPFVMLPPARAAATIPAGTTELSAAPVEQTKTVPPNIAVTFDDSGSMQWDYMSDNRPFDGGSWSAGPWYCAGVINPSATSGIGAEAMNGVYYNPNVKYVPPLRPDGSSFPDADSTLVAVWDDGIQQNRRYNQSTSGTTDFTNHSVNFGSSKNPSYATGYWQCPYASGRDYNLGQSGGYYTKTKPAWGGGPYYYQLTASALATLQGQLDKYGNPTTAGLSTLYNASNWQAVAVPASQYQNWANWWAYYHVRNLMARTALSRVFGSPSLANTTSDGGYGGNVRVVWQNLNNGNYKLPSTSIISALIDTSSCTTGGSANPYNTQRSGTTKTPPDCYRSAFFNWIFNVGANGSTPNRSALVRAGTFFQRGNGNTGATGDLTDPYWQPPQKGAFNATSNPGNELYCRQNFHLLLTDGLWNQDSGLPSVQALPQNLPDGVAFPTPDTSGAGNITSIYAPQHDSSGAVSLSDVAMVYWATNLRPDLFDPANGKYVPPYLPDTYTGVFTDTSTVQFVTGKDGSGNKTYMTIPTQQYFNPKNDPATWPHMSEYLVGLGVSGVLNFSANTDCMSAVAADLDACDLRKGVANSTGNTGWPTPNGSGNGIAANIDDTWHAALAGRGQFFSAGNPQQLVDQLSSILSSIAARTAATPAAVNASVATVGALSFKVGQNADWSGVFQAVTLNSDGTIDTTPKWDAGAQLASASASGRTIYTDSFKGGSFNAFPFTSANMGSLDTVETTGLGGALLCTSGTDTQCNRIDYLRGDAAHETDGTYRNRTDSAGTHQILGAILHSQPVYVSYPSSGYYNNWPSGSAEALGAAASKGNDDKSYDSFQTDHAGRPGTVYVGANDGMLHAFAAPAPTGCAADGTGCNYGNGGAERWAFVPRAVYANLGNLTNVTDFQFRATVDATPVTRDVFFSQSGHSEWHTILAGGVGVGGRGVYALDITDPTNFTASSVLWEFDSDIPISSGCTSIQGSAADTIGCRATDLGYTVSQPNIGRLNSGSWVVLVPNGYFPDCSIGKSIPTADTASCQAIAAQAPKDSTGNPYSALFVLDAQTGTVIAELKTPVISGVTSFGLATPVMGDYQGDQVDDVAFAGDLQGNLWRFDLSDPSAKNWTVTLVYKGLADASGNQGLQPITTMPRLFPDPATNRFMVVFGTGKYLGAGDNGNNAMQAIMGVRDVAGTTYSQADLVQNYLHEVQTTNPDGSVTTKRCLTGKSTDTCDPLTASPTNPMPSTGAGSGGWFFNLYTTTSSGTQNNQGERVVVSPGAIFSSNTVIFETLLTGSTGSDPCNPSTQGAIMALNAVTGGPSGASSLGSWPIIGARVGNARTSGSLPLVSALGGGQVYLPGVTIPPNTPISIDAPIWRRRSWQGIQQN